MAKYIIDSNTLECLGDSIRSITGSTKRFTPEEMINEVTNILNSATFILVDKDGNEYPASFLSSEPVFTATANDIRKGVTAITAEGLTVGTKVIPAYHTTEGFVVVPAGSEFVISFTNDRYDFTKFQGIICLVGSSINASVSAEKVVIGDKVYMTNSSDPISSVTKDSTNKKIKLGIVNDTDNMYLLRYFTYREEY